MATERKEVLDDVKEKVATFDVDGLKEACLKAISIGLSSAEIISAMSKGMDDVGAKYAAGEYFISELIMAGETMKEGLGVLKPHMTGEAEETPTGRTVVVGTVLKDLHDIGKNIAVTLLTTAGFKVIDLGVDVPAERFAEAVKNSGADIVGISALLTTTMEYVAVVIEELKKAGLRGKVKVIVGGAAITEEISKKMGADAYAEDAVTGVNICKKWAQE